MRRVLIRRWSKLLRYAPTLGVYDPMGIGAFISGGNQFSPDTKEVSQ